MTDTWFKAPADLMRDGRFVGLSVANQRHYLCLLMAKSSGLLDQDFSGCDPDFASSALLKQIAHFLWVSKAQANKIKQEFLRAGLINEAWQPNNWEARYEPSVEIVERGCAKTNADRQRDYRARKKDSVTNTVTNTVTNGRNARNVCVTESVTAALRDRNEAVTQQRNAAVTGGTIGGEYFYPNTMISDNNVDTDKDRNTPPIAPPVAKISPNFSKRAKRECKTPIPENFGISESVRAWASERGHGQLQQHLEHFIGYAKANGKTYANWDQALMNAIRGDWARLKTSTIAKPNHDAHWAIELAS